MHPNSSNSIEMNTQHWQHLSPIAIVYFAIKTLSGIGGNFIYLAPGLFIAYQNAKANPYVWFPIVGALLLIIVASGILSFYFFRFRLSDNRIEIKSGVFKKVHLDLPFYRIQNVKIEQPIYYRVFGFAILQLDTAGSAKQEANVAALSLTLAEKLKTRILLSENDLSQSHAEEQQAGISVVDEKRLNTRTIKDLIIHGVTSNRVWIILAALAPFWNKGFDKLTAYLQSMGIDLSQLLSASQTSAWKVTVLIMTFIFLFLLIVTTLSILGAIVSFYGFTLSKQEDKYIRRSGLFTKRETSVKVSRIQMIRRSQSWLDKLFKRCNLSFEQNNSAQPNQNQQSMMANKLMVPSITHNESIDLIKDVFPDSDIDNTPMRHISTVFILRYVFLLGTPLLLLGLSISFYHSNTTMTLSLIGGFVIYCALVWLRWKRWGVAWDEHYLYVRKGLIGQTYFCMPLFKLQQAAFKQSIFMKKRHLATVKVVLSSGSLTAPMLKVDDANYLFEHAVYSAESTRRSWM